MTRLLRALRDAHVRTLTTAERAILNDHAK